MTLQISRCIFAVCWFVLCVCTASEEATVLYGRSQVGKSLLVKKIALPGQGEPATGDGSGESVTEIPQLWKSKLGLVLDTPGIDDTLMRFTKEEAGRRMAVGVAAANVLKVKFLVFESLGGDTLQLRDTLASLSMAFGAQALQATVVLGSKSGMRSEQMIQKRVELIRQIMAEQDLKEFVIWDEDVPLDLLQAALLNIPGVQTQDLEDLWQRQRQRAQGLFDKQPVLTKNVIVDEEYAIPHEDQEPYEDPHVEQEPYEETYDSLEPYTATETKTVMVRQCRTKRRGGVAGLVGGKKEVCNDEPQQVSTEVQRQRSVQKTRTALRSVTKYRTKYRTVTRYETAIRQVTKTVEYHLPLEHFLPLALDEIVSEIRSSLQGKRSEL